MTPCSAFVPRPELTTRAAALPGPTEFGSLISWMSRIVVVATYRVLTWSRRTISVHSLCGASRQGVSGRSHARAAGLMLVVDAARRACAARGQPGTRAVFVDSFVAFVEREQMAPFFAAGRVGDGIVATSELIAARAEAAIAGGELVERAVEASSAGAGAESRAGLGDGYERPRASASVGTRAGPAPLEMVAAYVGGDGGARRSGGPRPVHR